MCLPWIKAVTNKVIILDLDETCIHTYQNMDDLKKLNIMHDPKLIDLRQRLYVLNINDVGERGNGQKSPLLWGVERPYLQEFLTFLGMYCRELIVWTAGMPPYAKAIVNHIFRGLPKPKVVYARTECVNEGTVNSPHYTKPISKLINSPYNQLHQIMDESNTMIIDDRLDYVKPNFSNAIIIPPYTPAPTIENLRQSDTALLKIMTWLNDQSIRQAPDVRVLPKEHIFTITHLVCSYSFDDDEFENKEIENGDMSQETNKGMNNEASHERDYINTLFNQTINIELPTQYEPLQVSA